MKKFLAVLVVLILILTALVVLAVMNLNYFVNQNKDYLLTQVEDSLGRELTVGNVETGFSDGIGIKISDFALYDDPGFSDDEFVSAKEIQINVSFFPLLSKEIVVTKLILNEPDINIIQNKEGEFNFSSLQKKGEGKQGDKEKTRSEDDNQPGSMPIAASNIEINDGTVTFIDEENARELQATDIDLGIDDLGFNKEIGIKLKAAVLAKSQNVLLDAEIGPISTGTDISGAELKGDTRISGLNLSALKKSIPALKEKIPQGLDFSGPLEAAFKFSGTQSSLMISDINVQAPLFGASQPNFSLTGSAGPIGEDAETLNLDVAFSLKNADINRLRKLSYLKKSIPNSLSTHGSISLSGKAAGRQNYDGGAGNIKLSDILVDATETRLAVIGKFLKPSGAPFVITTGADIGDDTVDLADTEIKLSSLILALSGQINSGTTTLLNLTLSSNNIVLSEMKEIFPALKKYGISGQVKLEPTKITGESGKGQTPEVRGAIELKNVSVTPPDFKQPVKDINTKIEFTGNSAEIGDMTLKLGQSRLRLSSKISRFSPLSLSYDLSSPELNLTALKKEPPNSNRPDVLKDLKSKGSFRMTNNIPSFTGNVSSSSAVLSDFELTDLKSNLSLAGKKAKVNTFSMKAYDGTISGKASYTMGDSPEFALISTVKGLDIKKFLTSRDPRAEQNIEGRAYLDLNVFGSGSKWEEVKTRLKGTAKAEVVDGAVLDVNIAEDSIEGITGIPGLTVLISPDVRRKYPQVFSTQDTEFDEFKGSFILERGKMRTSDLIITSSEFRITAKGWIDLDSRVDLKCLLSLSSDLSEDLTEDAPELKYITSNKGLMEIPFVISGKLPDAKPKPDTSYLASLVERATIRKGTEELKKQVLDKLLTEKEKENSQKETKQPAEADTGSSNPPKKKKKKRLDEKILDELGDLF